MSNLFGFIGVFGTIYQLYFGYALSHWATHDLGDILRNVFGPSVSEASKSLARSTELAYVRVGGGMSLEEGGRGSLGRILIASPLMLANWVCLCCGMLAALTEPGSPETTKATAPEQRVRNHHSPRKKK